MNDTVLMNPSEVRQAQPLNNLSTRLRFLGLDKPGVLLSCGESYRKLPVVNDIAMAQAFSGAWSFQPLKRRLVPTLALCHVDGVIRKVYKDLVWRLATPAEVELRRQFTEHEVKADKLWLFTGNEAPEYDQLLGVDLSEYLRQRGMNNPVRYVNCD